MAKMNILLILPTITQPRYQKRIDSLSKKHNVKIFAFDRGFYKKNSIKHHDLNIIGMMDNKKYHKRLFLYLKLLRVIFNNRKTTDMFYFFSIDIAFVGSLFLKKNKYIYEISDFAYLEQPPIIVKILTKLDLTIIRNSFRTILTSEGFKNYLVKFDRSFERKIIVQPNKPSPLILEIGRKADPIVSVEKLRFGFVGVLRYPTVFKFIRVIAEKFPQHEFKYFGDGGLTNDFIHLAISYPNLSYGGQFRNPDDLEKIYNEFDIHLACYDTAGMNERLAEPNKLYESIYFGNPIIATGDSFLGEKIFDLQVGYIINDFSTYSLVDFIDRINLEELNKFKHNMLKIEKQHLVDSDFELLKMLEFN